jgi:hypothetical protein
LTFSDDLGVNGQVSLGAKLTRTMVATSLGTKLGANTNANRYRNKL